MDTNKGRDPFDDDYVHPPAFRSEISLGGEEVSRYMPVYAFNGYFGEHENRRRTSTPFTGMFGLHKRLVDLRGNSLSNAVVCGKILLPATLGVWEMGDGEIKDNRFEFKMGPNYPNLPKTPWNFRLERKTARDNRNQEDFSGLWVGTYDTVDEATDNYPIRGVVRARLLKLDFP